MRTFFFFFTVKEGREKAGLMKGEKKRLMNINICKFLGWCSLRRGDGGRTGGNDVMGLLGEKIRKRFCGRF